ncbi:MAG: hypothetical protein JXQ90_19320 [Cyclobacteriaceae bacterium]
MIKVVVSLLLVTLTVVSYGQIRLNDEIEQQTLKGHCYTLADPENSLTPQEAMLKEWDFFGESEPKFGYAQYFHWLKFDLVNESTNPLERVIFLPYNHLKEAALYLADGQSIIKTERLGTMHSYINKATRTRGYPFLLTIEPGQQLTVLIRLDNRTIPLRASTFIVSKKRLDEIIIGTESVVWFWRGTFLFAIVVSLLLYYAIRQQLFLYYFFFTGSVMLFIGTEIGDFFYFFDRDPFNNISDIKHVFNFTCIYALPLFLNELTPLKETSSRLWKWMYRLSYPLGIMILIGFINGLKNTDFYLITDMYMLTYAMFVLFSLLYMLGKVTRQKKRNALVLFSTYMFYIGVLLISIILPAVGLKSESPHVNNELLIGGVFEVFTFLILMGRESIGIYKERALLQEKQRYHQREMLTAMVESQEKERNKVGRELHDRVGANMSILKQNVPQENEKLRYVIADTIESVRYLSHGLVTPRINSDEFVDEITDLCHLSSTNQLKVYPYFHGWTQIDNPEITTHLFRIGQELIQNAIKHSEATSVHLQFICEEDQLMLIYEDNGKGIRFRSARKKGIGLKGIENRVQLMNGSIEFAPAYRQQGTSITIQLAV